MDLGLKGKTALVAGSSQGIGFAVAAELTAEGANVAICARGRDGLDRAERKLGELSPEGILAVRADVTREKDVSRLVSACLERFGGLDILVTNAGGPPPTFFSNTPPEAWQQAIELNLLSAVRLCRAVVPHMKQRRWGRILMITSIAVKQPIPNLVLSNTARAGLSGFAKSLATELAGDGITVNNLCPGYTLTERLEELAREISEREKISVQAVYDRWTGDTPAGRLGDPREFGALAAFLASERAGYITGTAIQIDGGLYRGLF
jgi:3-oxoacyl-[acyl-carrier protein] reductase